MINGWRRDYFILLLLLMCLIPSCVVFDKNEHELQGPHANAPDTEDVNNMDETNENQCGPDDTCDEGLICLDLPPKRCVSSEPSTYIKGRIINSQTDEPIENCIVKTNPAIQQVLTDVNGNYSIYKAIDDMIGKEIQVIAECEGFKKSDARITVQKGANQAAEIAVSQLNSCAIELRPEKFDLGSTSGADFIVIERIGCNDSIEWEAQTTEHWVNLSPNQGVITNKPQTIKVSVERNGMQPGSYTAKINIATTIGEAFTIKIAMDVLSRCGDGFISTNEQCDDHNLQGATCGSLGFLGGTLRCNQHCIFNTKECYKCGDGIINGNEKCDGILHASDTCISNGFDEGTISCKEDCTLDFSSCVKYSCGDGMINNDEQCDGSLLNEATCKTQGFDGGVLACKNNCSFDTANCYKCGDGKISGNEQCDGLLLNGQTCETQNFEGGNLSCTEGCIFDLSGCHKCGDGIINSGETCDGDQLSGYTCKSKGYDGGTLACKNDCSFDISQCVNYNCGDGAINGSEQCDGSQLNNATCQSKGFDGGVIACADNCSFDTSSCYKCGDGRVNGNEQCDGSQLNNATCQSKGFDGGIIACSDNCGFDTSSCHNCSDKLKNGDETGVDCGGDVCRACNGDSCNEDLDCESTLCDAGTCLELKAITFSIAVYSGTAWKNAYANYSFKAITTESPLKMFGRGGCNGSMTVKITNSDTEETITKSASNCTSIAGGRYNIFGVDGNELFSFPSHSRIDVEVIVNPDWANIHFKNISHITEWSYSNMSMNENGYLRPSPCFQGFEMPCASTGHSCALGKQTCDDSGNWGECLGETEK